MKSFSTNRKTRLQDLRSCEWLTDEAEESLASKVGEDPWLMKLFEAFKAEREALAVFAAEIDAYEALNPAILVVEEQSEEEKISFDEECRREAEINRIIKKTQHGVKSLRVFKGTGNFGFVRDSLISTILDSLDEDLVFRVDEKVLDYLMNTCLFNARVRALNIIRSYIED